MFNFCMLVFIFFIYFYVNYLFRFGGSSPSVFYIFQFFKKALSLEEAVLGAMLLEREALSTVIDILSKEAFYKEQNGRVYAAMVALFNRSEPVDILTVTQELKRSGELELVWFQGIRMGLTKFLLALV